MIKNERSPSRPQRILVEQTSNIECPISTTAFYSLAKQAGKNKVLLSILEQVYCRGIIDANPHSRNTSEQNAFNRVNSFLHQGKAYELDHDLAEQITVPDGRKHMHIIKKAIKGHQERNKPLVEDGQLGRVIGRVIHKALYGRPSKKSKPVVDKDSDEYINSQAQKKIENKSRSDRIKNVVNKSQGQDSPSVKSTKPSQSAEQRSQAKYAQKNMEAQERDDAQVFVNKHGGRNAVKAIINQRMPPRAEYNVKMAIAQRHDDVIKRADRMTASHDMRTGQNSDSEKHEQQGFYNAQADSARRWGKVRFRQSQIKNR